MKPETIEKIKAHYNHAKRKHPKFVDEFYAQNHHTAQTDLAFCRNLMKRGVRAGYIESDDIIRCEIAEIYEAYTDGRLADAKEECYDAIAVLLRMIDMIEKEESNDKH